MKLIDQLVRPVGHPIGMYVEMIGKRKMHILVATLFLFGSFFLSQAVLFDAAVPFFLPVWALGASPLQKTSDMGVHWRDVWECISWSWTSCYPSIDACVIQCGY